MHYDEFKFNGSSVDHIDDTLSTRIDQDSVVEMQNSDCIASQICHFDHRISPRIVDIVFQQSLST